MIYDDDTGRRAEFEIRTEDHGDDHPPARAEQLHLPAQHVQDEIAALAQQSGWGVERIYALLRRKRHDIPRATIRHIINRVDTSRLADRSPTTDATEGRHHNDDPDPESQ